MSEKKVSIALIISSMGPGGAEKVLATMANYWACRDKDIHILSFSGPDEQSFYSLAPGVHYSGLNLLSASRSFASALYGNIKRVVRLRRELRCIKPVAVVSFMTETNVVSVIAATGLRLPVVVTEHTDPFTNPISRIWRLLSKLMYRRARFIVVLSSYAAEYFHNARNVRIIPNPVPPCNDAGRNLPSVPRSRIILAVGRLGPEKCHNLLIEAFARLGDVLSGWHLRILGEGLERSALANLAVQLHVADRVDMPGTVTDPREEMRNAGIFVLSSRIEGFPMSLCEAMACGAPVIATEYNKGIYDIIQHEENGIVIPKEDVEAMTQAIDRLASNKTLRDNLGSHAASVAERFETNRIMARWDEIIEHCHSPA